MCKPFYKIYLVLLLCLSQSISRSQNLLVDGGFVAQVEITFGNQNQWLKLGVYGFGILNYGDISVESGASFSTYQFLKRHTKKINGFAYSYDFFGLAGLGKNTNMLGSSILSESHTIIFNTEGKGGFNGLGFGFTRDVLPNLLTSYGLQRGMFMLRFSNANHSIHLSFLNDFKIGLFNGTGTDYGVTGSLRASYTEIRNRDTVYQLGLGIDLFTPRPNYSRSPRNPINSDDGRKNVWYTLPPFTDLFYGNLYAYGSYQENTFSYRARLGINSQKAGAYIQNKLHDGLGLNPRFPWLVDAKDKLFIELTGSTFYKEPTND